MRDDTKYGKNQKVEDGARPQKTNKIERTASADHTSLDSVSTRSGGKTAHNNLSFSLAHLVRYPADPEAAFEENRIKPRDPVKALWIAVLERAYNDALGKMSFGMDVVAETLGMRREELARKIHDARPKGWRWADGFDFYKRKAMRVLQQDAWDWFLSMDRDTGSFLWVCDAVGADPRMVLRRIRENGVQMKSENIPAGKN